MKLKLDTDDNKFMGSNLELDEVDGLNVIEFKHLTHYGGQSIFYLYKNDIQKLVEYLNSVK